MRILKRRIENYRELAKRKSEDGGVSRRGQCSQALKAPTGHSTRPRCAHRSRHANVAFQGLTQQECLTVRVYTWSGFWQIQAFEQWIRSLRSQNEFIAKSDKELSKCTARRSDSARVCERSLPRSDWCSQGLTSRHANVAFPGLT